MAFLANDTDAQCKEVAKTLPPTVCALPPCLSMCHCCLTPARARPCPLLRGASPACPRRAMKVTVARRGQPHSGARCPVRPPGVDEAIQMVIQATPDPDEKDFRTLPNSL